MDIDLGLGEASFNNTGGARITMWNQQLTIARHPQPLDLKIHIHVEDGEIVFIKNGEEQRIPVDAAALSEPTAIDFRWRTRTAHFRHIKIDAESLVPVH